MKWGQRGEWYVVVQILLFGLIFLVSSLMALFYAPIEGIMAEMRERGATAELEARLCTQVNRGAAVTVTLFLLLASMAFLGLSKPF